LAVAVVCEQQAAAQTKQTIKDETKMSFTGFKTMNRDWSESQRKTILGNIVIE
jgi:hypothetical protein